MLWVNSITNSHKYSLSLHNALGKNEKAFDLKDGGLQQQQAAAASNFTFTFSKDFSSGEKRGMGTALDWQIIREEVQKY